MRVENELQPKKVSFFARLYHNHLLSPRLRGKSGRQGKLLFLLASLASNTRKLTLL
jgi:hypothetical protein